MVNILKHHSKYICYIGGFDLPDGNAAAQRVVANSYIFSKLGYEVFLIGLTNNKKHNSQFSDLHGLKCINLPYPKTFLEWFKYVLSIDQYTMFFSKRKPDIIIAYNFPAIPLYELLAYGKKHNIKILADSTEWYQPQGNILFKIIKGFDVAFRMKYVHKRLDGLIVISRYLYNYYQNSKIPLLLLPPLIDIENPKWFKFGEKQEIDGDITRLVYAGSIGRGNKDRLDLIISSLIRLHEKYNINLRLEVIGINRSDFDNTYSEINYSVPEYIHFVGRISHDDVIERLCNADFQIFIRENNLANTAGFPTKFVETLTCKVLVLTNYSSDLREYLIEGVNGFSLDISSEETLIHSLLEAMTISKEEIFEMKNKIITTTFDYRNFIVITNDFLKQM